jgi:hemolysin III
MNMTTHIVGGGLALAVLTACLWKAIGTGRAITIAAALIYGLSMVLVYAMSSIYHGLRPGTGKKVLQVLDHCAIYLLIAGTYTPIALLLLVPRFPWIGWGILAAQWFLAALAITLTAIDLRKYRELSMCCYIGMGWGILLFLPQLLSVMPRPGFLLLLSGGIAYTIGAILFGLGKKQKWMHSVFHIFVILGSLLQFLCLAGWVF